MQKELKAFDGAILLVSHDRQFLDEICNSILEIEDGKINFIKVITPNIRNSKKRRENERNLNTGNISVKRKDCFRLLRIKTKVKVCARRQNVW